MITIQLSEQTNELAYVVAAIGRVKEPGNVELFARLYAIMDASEMVTFHKLYETMEFTDAIEIRP